MSSRSRNAAILKMALLGVLIAAVALAPFLVEEGSFPTPDMVQRWLDHLGILAPFAYMAVMALVVVTPLPSLPLNFVAGAFFGPVLGTLYSVAGATAGATVSFLIARFLGRDLLEGFLKGHILFCTGCSDRLLSKIVLIGRLVPVLSFDMISYGAGLTAMSVRSFVLANFLGMLPLTFAYNYFGSTVTVGRGASVVLGLLFLALFFLLPHWIERYDLFSLRRYIERHRDGGKDHEGIRGDRT